MEGLIVRVPTGLDVLVRLKGLPARELEIDFVLPFLADRRKVRGRTIFLNA